MMSYKLLLVPMAVLLPAGLLAQQRHGSGGSARDAFWSASDLFAVTPNPARHAAPKAPKPKAAAKPSGDKGNDNGIVGDPVVANNAPAHAQNVAQLVSENGYGAAPHLLRTPSESRLGLRYSVLLRDGDGQYAEVHPGTVFHSGDHIRLSLMANEPGYLYVIEQGSSGSWSPIFPKAGAGADSNRIEAGVLEEVPGKASFQFDQHAGEEKLFVILSKAPIADLDQKIQALKGKTPVKENPPAQPAGEMLEAENHIPDVFVQQLASRDLTLVDEEKVDEAATASHGSEKAVYVVSKMANEQGSGTEVVASIKLAHE
jgi:hypothetical protein